VVRGSGATFLRPPLPLVGGVVFAVGLASFFRVPVLPDIARDLSLSTGQISLITTAFAVGRLVVDLPAGRVADLFPVSRVLAGAGLALCGGSLLLGLSGSLTQAVAASAVLGIASSVTNTTGIAQFAGSVPAERRGSALAVFSMALLTGQTFGPALGGALAELDGWRTAVMGGCVVGVAVSAVCLVRGGRAEFAQGPGKDGGTDENGGVPLTPGERVVLAAVPFSVFFGMAALPHTLVPLIGAREVGLSASVIGLVLGIGGVSRFVGAAVTGAVSDRFSRKAALVPNLTVMGSGALLLTFQTTFVSWTASVVLFSLGSTGMSVAATILGDRASAGRVARQLSGFRFTGDLGLLTGPLVVGWIYERLGRAESVAVVALLLICCAVASAIVIKEGRPTHPSREDAALGM
jgi:MFS transporter, DHA1 family, multidrug resistance protein